MNKLEQVANIAKTFIGSKKELLDKIVQDLSITRANASVYLYKLSKQAPTAKPVNDPESQVKPKKTKEPDKPLILIDKAYTGKQILEYMSDMDYRQQNGYSFMSIAEYFEVKENLAKVLEVS